MKKAKAPQLANRKLLRVVRGTDYTPWIIDFIGSNDPSTNILVTFEGSKILRSRELNEKCRIACISLSEELQVRQADHMLVLRLSEGLISETLRWTLQNMKNGKLVFDNLSRFTLLAGPDAAYALVTMISELSARYGIDVLFIIRDNVLDDKVQNALEEIVGDVLLAGQGDLFCSTRKQLSGLRSK